MRIKTFQLFAVLLALAFAGGASAQALTDCGDWPPGDTASTNSLAVIDPGQSLCYTHSTETDSAIFKFTGDKNHVCYNPDNAGTGGTGRGQILSCIANTGTVANICNAILTVIDGTPPCIYDIPAGYYMWDQTADPVSATGTTVFYGGGKRK